MYVFLADIFMSNLNFIATACGGMAGGGKTIPTPPDITLYALSKTATPKKLRGGGGGAAGVDYHVTMVCGGGGGGGGARRGTVCGLLTRKRQ